MLRDCFATENFITGCSAVGSALALGAWSPGSGRSPWKTRKALGQLGWQHFPPRRKLVKNRRWPHVWPQLENFITGCSAVGSALALGARCREFESPHSDQKPPQNISFEAVFITFQTIIYLTFCTNMVSNVVNSLLRICFEFSLQT